jgi:chromosome segregation ATPase
MSDDLVKRLVDWSEHDEGKINDARQEAADRIATLTEQLEQLVAINEAARADAKEAEVYAEELAKDQVDLCSQLIAAEDKLAECEARLGKAVEALRYYAGRTTYRLCDDCPVQVHSSADLSGPARTTLTELEGSTSEGEKG